LRIERRIATSIFETLSDGVKRRDVHPPIETEADRNARRG